MVTSLLTLALLAAAPPSEADRLFDAGKKLMAERPAEACPLFEKSFEVEPALGTLLNLALCFEKTDRPASAWLRFNQAREWATRTHEMDREKAAREHADALAPKLSWLSLAAARPVPGLEVQAGPHRLPLGSASSVPVDPGTIAVTASAPGYRPWETSVQAPAPGKSTSVIIPELESLSPPPDPQPQAIAAPSDRPIELEPTPSVFSERVAAATVHPTRGPGAALTATGAVVAVFGIVSLAYSVEVYSRAQSQRLDGELNGPPTVTRAEFDTAKTLYPTSIVAIAVGVAAAGVGTWLFVRSAPAVSVSAAPVPGGAVLVAGGSL